MGLIIETKNLIKRTDNSIYIIKEKIKRIEKRVGNNVEYEQEKPSFNCLYKQCDDIETAICILNELIDDLELGITNKMKEVKDLL